MTYYILCHERTDYGNRIRKKYESGDLKERICNMRQVSIGKDGYANTLTTLLKDNIVLEIRDG